MNDHFLFKFDSKLILLALFLFAIQEIKAFQNPATDSLPTVFNDETDILYSQYRHRASIASKLHQIPADLQSWEYYRKKLKEQIIQHTGTKLYPNLPLALKETGSYKGDGFTVKNIYFQTRPQVYATANLYIPDGTGKFPAVIVMMGHSRDGKLYENYQLVGQTLAKEGYVALCIDPWGAGERTTQHGDFEYHGTYLGASLLNIGESLMGMQITDNIRGIDLLQSLPYVDAEKIGATGASGGGNQTMWLAAVDERVKAAMPVVSVGTFNSYVMGHNCVCEVLPNGLTFTGEWGVLSLVAPRALRMCNHNQESNPAFFPSEMLKSFRKAQPVFAMYNVPKHIDYQLFDRPHGYFPEDREALLGFMDYHLKGKGDGSPRKEKMLEPLPASQLMVFKEGDRDPLIHSTASFCRYMGQQLREEHLNAKALEVVKKRNEFEVLLGVKDRDPSAKATTLGTANSWKRITLQTQDGGLLPVLLKVGKRNEFAILAHADGKQNLPLNLIQSIENAGLGMVVIDFSGTGEAASEKSAGYDKLGKLHTYGRAALWVGETVIGNWVYEMKVLTNWLEKEYNATSLTFYGFKEAGLAGIFYNALGGEFNEIHTYQTPWSYLFDQREGLDYFGVGIHIPGILKWGDVSVAAALSNADVYFNEAVTMSGFSLTSAQKSEAHQEFSSLKKKSGTRGKIEFR